MIQELVDISNACHDQSTEKCDNDMAVMSGDNKAHRSLNYVSGCLGGAPGTFDAIDSLALWREDPTDKDT